MAYNPLQYLTQNQPNTFAMLSQVGRSLGEGRRRQMELARQAEQREAGQRAAGNLGLLAQDSTQFTPEMQGQFYQDALASGQGGLLLGEYSRLTDVDAPIDWSAVSQIRQQMDNVAANAIASIDNPEAYQKALNDYASLNGKHIELTNGENYESPNFKRLKEMEKLGAESAKAETQAKSELAKQNKEYVDSVNNALDTAYKRNQKGIDGVKKALDFAGQARDNIMAALKKGGSNDAILSQITRALVKIQDPNSAVMQGEADAMLGTGAIVELRRAIERLRPLIKEGDAALAENRAQATDINKLVEAYNALLPSLKRTREEILAGGLNDSQLQTELGIAKQVSGVEDSLELENLLKQKAQSQLRLSPVPAPVTGSAIQNQQQSTNATGTPKNKQEFLQKWKGKK